MTLRPILCASVLDASQRLLLALLSTLAVEGESGAWVAAPVRRLAEILGADLRSVKRDLATLRVRGVIRRAARLEVDRFAPGWYVDVAPLRKSGPPSGNLDPPPVDATSRLKSGPPSRNPAPPRSWTEPLALAAAALGDDRAADWIAARYYEQAERTARRLGEPDAASEGLLQALRTFNPHRGTGFSTHLVWCIRSAVRDERRRRARDPASAAGWDVEGERLDPDALDAGLDPAAELDAGRELERLAAAGGAVAVDLVEGHSAEETAARTGRSVHAIRRERTRVRALARG